MKWNEPAGSQIQGRQNSWQLVKHENIYSDPMQTRMRDCSLRVDMDFRHNGPDCLHPGTPLLPPPTQPPSPTHPPRVVIAKRGKSTTNPNFSFNEKHLHDSWIYLTALLTGCLAGSICSFVRVCVCVYEGGQCLSACVGGVCLCVFVCV